jgi:putative ABC transport system permease protein
LSSAFIQLREQHALIPLLRCAAPGSKLQAIIPVVGGNFVSRQPLKARPERNQLRVSRLVRATASLAAIRAATSSGATAPTSTASASETTLAMLEEVADPKKLLSERTTMSIQVPRIIPKVTSSTGETPLETMLRRLRVHKPGPFVMIRTSCRNAVESIWVNRLRSFLTTLSIFIGVAAVIAALILIQGTGIIFTDTVAGLDDRTVIIDGGVYSSGGAMQSQSVQALTTQDMLEIEHVPHVAALSPVVDVSRQVSAPAANRSWDVNIFGVSAAYQGIRQWYLLNGLWFSNADDTATRPVAVIGATLAQNIFAASGLDPLGQRLIIGEEAFHIIGVLAPKGGFRLDNVVFVPYHTALHRFSISGGVNRIEAQVDNVGHVDLTVSRMAWQLRRNHALPRSSPNDFQITLSSQLLEQVRQELQAMTILLTGASGILLMAGGIGIMNIMMASMTGRTREIGIRVAVGAQHSAIRNQFLLEALILCLIGGSMGMLAGLGAGFALTNYIAVPFIVTPITYILPFALSSLIGVVFGLYPAIKAARLDPVIALQRGTRA